jgi:hypothetical protein
VLLSGLAGGALCAVPRGAAAQALDVDRNGNVDVATDVAYIARRLLGLVPVPASFRALDPTIPADNVIGTRIDTLATTPCQGGPLAQPLKTGQTTSYGTGSDGAVLKGATRSYTDNGDGTITDNATGLMWEKKDRAGGIHYFGTTYTWGMESPPYTMNGTMVTEFLAPLNAGAGFAGHCDWRIPNLNELQSIANYQNWPPAVDAAFNTGCAASCTVLTCSCTSLDNYWSSTTSAFYPTSAWYVYFTFGAPYFGSKTSGNYVRAVRGGS